MIMSFRDTQDIIRKKLIDRERVTNIYTQKFLVCHCMHNSNVMDFVGLESKFPY